MQQDQLSDVDEEEFNTTDVLQSIQDEQRDKLINIQTDHRNIIEHVVHDLTQCADPNDEVTQYYIKKSQLQQMEVLHEQQKVSQQHHMELQKQQEKHLIELHHLHLKFMKEMQDQQLLFTQQHQEFKEFIIAKHKNGQQSSASASTSASTSGGATLLPTNSPRFQ